MKISTSNEINMKALNYIDYTTDNNYTDIYNVKVY